MSEERDTASEDAESSMDLGTRLARLVAQRFIEDARQSHLSAEQAAAIKRLVLNGTPQSEDILSALSQEQTQDES